LKNSILNKIQNPERSSLFIPTRVGPGRSMALANVACLLTRKLAGGKGVLMVDWDLEAPGLHRFFHDRLTRRLGQSDEKGQFRLTLSVGQWRAVSASDNGSYDKNLPSPVPLAL
jgi:hypothetical protein